MSDTDQSMPSLEGLVTIPCHRVFEIAGHQITFHFELTPIDMLRSSTIYVPGLGKITYTSKHPCDSHADALRWLESLDMVVARKTLSYLHNKVKAINGKK